MQWIRLYKNKDCLPSVYFAMVVIRFLSTLFYQTGYIYPDEFFQSPEIMAKDFLSLNTTATWEWKETFPVRSPVSAFFTSGIPYLVLKVMSGLKLMEMNAYLLLIFPRIYMALLSVLCFDVPVYVLCKRLGLDPFPCLFVLSTSYITLVFGTRPFSNILETAILGILLVTLITSPKIQTHSHPEDKDKPPLQRGKMEINMSTVQCIFVGSLTSLGLFCRQTFLVFAIIPCGGSLLSLVRWPKASAIHARILTFLSKLFLMAFSFVVTSSIMILVDSWYFRYLQRSRIVFTPWNFIKYNTMQAEKHGHHPMLTHLLVNLPLLFGPISFLWYFKFGSIIVQKTQIHQANNQHDLDYKHHYKLVLILAVLFPLLVLSFIPHQEPRFIIPVIIPLILLFSHKIVGPDCTPIFLLSWCVWNVIGYFFFGVFHQGGVVSSLLHLERTIKNNVRNSPVAICHHVVYFHTYMPPKHLLMWPDSGSTMNGHRLYLHDLAGASQEVFHQTKFNLLTDYCDRNQSMLYVVCPGTVKINLTDHVSAVNFFPHLTMEDPPDFNHHFTELLFGLLDTSSLGHNGVAHKEYITSHTEHNILHKLKIYLHLFISQFQELKFELSLNLYVSKL